MMRAMLALGLAGLLIVLMALPAAADADDDRERAILNALQRIQKEMGKLRAELDALRKKRGGSRGTVPKKSEPGKKLTPDGKEIELTKKQIEDLKAQAKRMGITLPKGYFDDLQKNWSKWAKKLPEGPIKPRILTPDDMRKAEEKWRELPEETRKDIEKRARKQLEQMQRRSGSSGTARLLREAARRLEGKGKSYDSVRKKIRDALKKLEELERKSGSKGEYY